MSLGHNFTLSPKWQHPSACVPFLPASLKRPACAEGTVLSPDLAGILGKSLPFWGPVFSSTQDSDFPPRGASQVRRPVGTQLGFPHAARLPGVVASAPTCHSAKVCSSLACSSPVFIISSRRYSMSSSSFNCGAPKPWDLGSVGPLHAPHPGSAL